MYKYSDIILCAPGIGRTTFTKDTNFCYEALDVPTQTIEHVKNYVDKIIDLQNSKKYRYLLLPIVPILLMELTAREIRHIKVMISQEDINTWVKRWMKAGASVEIIKARLEDVFQSMREPMPKGFGVTIYLDKDEWLGHILEQSPISADGERDT